MPYIPQDGDSAILREAKLRAGIDGDVDAELRKMATEVLENTPPWLRSLEGKINTSDFYLAAQRPHQNKLTQTAGDVAGIIGNMIMPIAAGTAGSAFGLPALGSAASMSALGASAYGAKAQQALAAGADIRDARYAGVAAGAKEIATELPFGGIFGLPSGIFKLGGKPIVRFLGNALGNAAEEVFSQALDSYIDQSTWNSEAERATLAELKQTGWTSLWASMILGTTVTFQDGKIRETTFEGLDIPGLVKKTWPDATPEQQAQMADDLVARLEQATGVMYRDKGYTQQKAYTKENKTISQSLFDSLIRPIELDGGLILRGTKETDEHLERNGASASQLDDIIMFRSDATVSDVLEEICHYNQNKKGLNNDKPERLRSILNEIDAKKYLLSVTEEYKIPIEEVMLTKKQLSFYEEELRRWRFEHENNR